MEFLASDALNGRGSGTRDEQIAATYIASQFRLWGLEPMGDDGGFVQQIEMASLEAVSPPVLQVGDVILTHGKDMLVWTMTAPALSGTVVKYRTGADVPAGAVVLMPEDAVVTAALAGVALVIAPETAQVREQWATRAARQPAIAPRALKLSVSPPGRPSLIYLDKAAYSRVTALADGAKASFKAEMKTVQPSTYTWNAVGTPDRHVIPLASREVLVLSAHLDHVGARPPSPGVDTIYNGADDDASGTVAVMALAEALAKGPRPKRTIVFALFGSEERGGFGAGFFVDLPVVPLREIIADLQFEMLGRPDPLVPARTLWLTGYERSNLGEELAKHGARLVADPHPKESFFTRSDNIRFARRGVVAHTVSSYGLHKEYHQPSDEIRAIDFAHMTEAIRSLLAPVQWLASSTFRPAWNKDGCPAPCK